MFLWCDTIELTMRGEQETIDLDALLGASQRTLAAAAHELKAPLSLIRMYAAYLDEASLTAEQRRQYHARLLFTAEQMLQLATGLLEGYRWGQEKLPLEPVNAHVICEEILHELTPAAAELGQSLEYGATSRPLIAVAHPLLLKNVLFNVTFNAIRHTPPETSVRIAANRHAERAHISVLDTGPGFQKQTIRRFGDDIGERLQATSSRSGSGLGLAIAKQLTRAMQGTLEIKASPKGGYCLLSLQTSKQISLLT